MAQKTVVKKPQDDLHVVLKPIRYHGEGEYHRTLVRPEDGVLLPFGHLSDVDYALVLKLRLVAPATSADKKVLSDADKAAVAAVKERAEAAKAEAAKRAALKAAANTKQTKAGE